MVALARVPACASHRTRDASNDLRRLPVKRTAGVGRTHTKGCFRKQRDVLVFGSNNDCKTDTNNSSGRRLFSVGVLAPLGAAYDWVGAWLVQHPAPQWVVNSPFKTRATEFLASVLNPSFDMDESITAVQALIKSDDVVIFSATYCPFSAAAKAALGAEGVPFTAVEWNKTEGGAGFAPALAKLYDGRSSIPHIFINGKSIGGCNDGTPGIRPLIAAGGLDDALEGCSETTRNARMEWIAARGNKA